MSDQESRDCSNTSKSRDELRSDLSAEYQIITKTVSDFDGRLITVKSWSVTVSLAGIGAGIQADHYSLFLVGGIGALSFYLIEVVMKHQQMRYYPRMREIEVAATKLNDVELNGMNYSSPQIDWWWDKQAKAVGKTPTSRNSVPRLRLPFYPHVAIPSLLIAIVGITLFFFQKYCHVLGSLAP
jgi:hypothetical protein